MILFTNRIGGFSTGEFESFNLGEHVGDDPILVERNRATLVKDYGPVQFMNQEHGNRIAVIEEVTPTLAQDLPRADALVTGIQGITLAVMVADCIPLLLTSKQSVAAVHVGRRGLINGVTIRTIELMREMGARAISATIGPAICGHCYEVSQEIYDEVVSTHPAAKSKSRAAQPALNLVKALISDLQNFKIDKIDNQSRCTYENIDLFSYRRDGRTGRQVGLVRL